MAATREQGNQVVAENERERRAREAQQQAANNQAWANYVDSRIALFLKSHRA